MGLAGLLVGAVAAGIEAGIASDQTNKIDSALASQKFDGEVIFDAALEANLKAQNFDISTIKIERDEYRNFVVVKPQADAKTGTAVLDVKSNDFGYQQVGGLKWRPYVVAAVKMYDAQDPKKILLDNVVEYNAVAPGTVTVNIAGDEAYAFEKVEDIKANPEKATEGLKLALEATAKAIAQLLK
jgi:hypothetical protein